MTRHDHAEMLDHLQNEWGTLGLIHEILRPLGPEEKVAVLRAAASDVGKFITEEERQVINDLASEIVTCMDCEETHALRASAVGEIVRTAPKFIEPEDAPGFGASPVTLICTECGAKQPLMYADAEGKSVSLVEAKGWHFPPMRCPNCAPKFRTPGLAQ